MLFNIHFQKWSKYIFKGIFENIFSTHISKVMIGLLFLTSFQQTAKYEILLELST